MNNNPLITSLISSGSLEERTRSLLGGWRDTPSCSSSPFSSSSSSSSVCSMTSPVKGGGRKRRQSVSSTSSSDFSDASPYSASISTSPIPRKTSCPEGPLLTRLRGLLHDLPSDASAYQRLLDGVTSAMEDERRGIDGSKGGWRQPKQEILSQPASPFDQPSRIDDFPVDLMSVDVSAFASLIMYQRPV
ncbi:hypothetical protein PENTCL1PPCAC_11105 [Pristionchus entomophagus]|uniref:Uncharacterized protein n=1 Tax=Pristionchus entomophagus TaxID=358040 RepID=A0AAV5T1J5_9BILA|nr:hypothetical protein PENTCL1PPCAC_11105 [Pristionchus entomophagus]